jgi:hypothetical protein
LSSGTEAAPITEVTTMDDIKKGFREAQESTKETWRNRDGESPSDAVGNAGDDLRKGLGNAGDDTREGANDASKEADYEHDTNVSGSGNLGTNDTRY